MAFLQVSVLSLARHYCNSAVARGRYRVISFWACKEEAIRTLWECLRISRAMEKELRDKMLEVQRLQVKLDEANAMIVRFGGAAQ